MDVRAGRFSEGIIPEWKKLSRGVFGVELVPD
jgi:hypothetical protein